MTIQQKTNPEPAKVFEGNYFLEGNYGPVQEEHVATKLQVIGEIPTDLKGHYLRIGPNPVYVSNVEKYHWFDGDGMVHAVQFENGTATYRNRFVDTEGLRWERKVDHWLWRGLNGMLDGGPAEMPEGAPAGKNPGNTAFVNHNGTLYALHEGSVPHILSLPDLKTVGTTDFDGKLTHAFTAHPKVDPSTGEMMTFGYGPFPPFVTYSVVNKEGALVHSTPITIPKGVMMHDFACSKNYSIFLDFPLTFDIEAAMEGKSPLGFEAEHGSRIGIMPRYGSDEDVTWFTVDVGVVIHTANAWEEGDVVVIQACRSKSSDIIGAAEVDTDEPTDLLGQMYEWRINVETGDITEGPLHDYYSDFSRINEAYAGSKTRYTYSSEFDQTRAITFKSIMKFDRETGNTLHHNFGEGRYVGEAVFAPKIGSSEEDDGYVICFIQDENVNQSECVVIDAKNFSGDPVARILIPHRVPYGFHSGWVGT